MTEDKQAVRLKAPLGEEVLKLKAGDHVLLSGTIYTARDEAHLEMMKDGIPFDPKGAVIYHCGPVIQDNKIIAAGPTTSARMNNICSFLPEEGVKAFIGKGGMSDEVSEALRDKGVYLAFTGGCAALAASRMELKGVYFEELGMAEAIWIIDVKDLPLTVAMDAHRGNLYSDVRGLAEEKFREIC
ncbi:FumA C-terminus/TtdB family hydratase beta subunit [Methanoplanus endosymbiosus]|uniref:FumA C-terminus/TtdB family hydratase beta subunit n=1 Tax=Methanoplanus endosymbiosus TaxID=33865 RepID=A0A9E7PQT7_9EURY|nr:FumA C-terminus/TtdB family hydratase beta subunit [Methanoplanus endosymbiosus]UUX91777.1 FumA C-terminus/TtdB family hydratase beta subunit [Methanoplanus endosymbiosus]